MTQVLDPAVIDVQLLILQNDDNDNMCLQSIDEWESIIDNEWLMIIDDFDNGNHDH